MKRKLLELSQSHPAYFENFQTLCLKHPDATLHLLNKYHFQFPLDDLAPMLITSYPYGAYSKKCKPIVMQTESCELATISCYIENMDCFGKEAWIFQDWTSRQRQVDQVDGKNVTVIGDVQVRVLFHETERFYNLLNYHAKNLSSDLWHIVCEYQL